MLHENLRNLRKRKGLSQQELADKVGVVRQTISKWENGDSTPDSVSLIKIANVLQIPLNDVSDHKPTRCGSQVKERALKSGAGQNEYRSFCFFNYPSFVAFRR